MIELSKKFEVLHGHIIGGKGIKKIAKENGLSKTTVKKYIREYKEQKREILEGGDKSKILQSMNEEPKYKIKKERVKKVVTPEVEEIIRKCLEENERKKGNGQGKQCMKSTDIHEEITKAGIKISYQSVNKSVRKQEERVLEAYIKQTYEYGEVCEFDWGEVKLIISGNMIKYRLAVFTLAATNIRYGVLYRTEDTQAFVESHVQFYAYMNGVPKCMVYDNMKVAVAQFVGKTEKMATIALKQMSTYYGFAYRFCNIRRGNEKGHVERSVEYVRRKAFSGKSEFESWEEANARLAETIERLNADKAESFESERKGMVEKMPDYSSVVRALGIVDKLSTVVYKQNHYSVPDYLVDKEVEILAYIEEIVIKYKGNEVGRHRRIYERHEYSLDIMHYRETLMRKPGALGGSLCLKQASEKLREIYEKHFKSSAKEFVQMLDLLEEHSIEKIESAVKTLEESGAKVQLDSLKMILSNKIYEYQSDKSDEIEKACEAQLGRYAEVRAI